MLARPNKCRNICSMPQVTEFVPAGGSEVTRIYEDARRKIAEAMVFGRRIVIEGGDVMVCRQMKPECKNEINCCHRQREKVE